MHLYFAAMLVTVGIHILLSIISYTVLVEPVVLCDTVVKVQGQDGLVQALYHVDYVTSVVTREWTVVSKPSELWRVHNLPNCDSILEIRVLGPGIQDGGSEPTEPINELLLGTASKKVVVPCNKDNIHSSRVRPVNIV